MGLLRWLTLVLAATAAACAPALPQKGNLVANPGFESGDPLPTGWYYESSSDAKGRAWCAPEASAPRNRVLRLEPNAQNSDPAKQIGVGQAFPAGPFLGKRVWLSARLAAGGGAKASVALLAFSDGKAKAIVTLDRFEDDGGLALLDDVLAVPQDPSIQQLILVCTVAGTTGYAAFDDVVVSADVPESIERRWFDPGPPIAASVKIDAARVVRDVPRTLYGINTEWLWDGKGLFDPAEGRLRPDVIRLTKALGPTLIRWPGGTFSDFYHWKQALGPQSARPSSRPMPTNDLSKHTVGTDEILDFARQTGAGLLFTANAGSGTPEEAADWVRYTNAPGKRPAVRFWEIGNELYIDDRNLGADAVTQTPEKYAETAERFADAIRRADPTVKIGAILDENHYPGQSYQNWTETVLRRVAPKIDFVSVHNAYAPVIPTVGDKTVRQVYAALLAAPLLVKRNLDELDAKIRRLAPAEAGRLEVAVTEWGTIFQVEPSGPFVDHCKTLGSALHTASVMKAFLETPRVEIANYFGLIDPTFIGVLGLRDGAYAPTASYFALQLFTRHFGDRLVPSAVVSPVYSSPSIGWIRPVARVPYVEAVSSLGSGGKTLHVVLINKHFDRAANVALDLAGFDPESVGERWELGGTGIDAHTGTAPLQVPGLAWGKQAEDEHNPRFSKGGPSEVWLRSSKLSGAKAKSTITVPAHSVTCLVLRRKTNQSKRS